MRGLIPSQIPELQPFDWENGTTPSPITLAMCNCATTRGGKERSLFDVDFFPFNLQLRLPFLELVTRWQIPPPSTQRCSFFETKIQTMTCPLFIQNPTPK